MGNHGHILALLVLDYGSGLSIARFDSRRVGHAEPCWMVKFDPQIMAIHAGYAVCIRNPTIGALKKGGLPHN